ncbi:MAG TPA: hypothetical protein VF006_09015 [Longimicrobium sp.]
MSIAAPITDVPAIPAVAAPESTARARFGYGFMTRRLRDEARTELARRVERFNAVAPLLPQPAATYQRELRYHERRLVHAIRRARTRGLIRAFYGAYAVVTIGYMLLMMALYRSTSALPGNPFMGAYLAFTAAYALAYAGAAHVERKGARSWTRSLAGMLRGLLLALCVLAFLGAAVITVGIVLGEELDTVMTRVYAGCVAPLFALLSVSAFRAVMRRYERRAGRSVHHPHPESLVVHELVETLRTSGGSPARWGRLNVRNRLIGHLEATALCFEEYIPTRVAAGGMHAAVEDDCRRIAAGFREMVHWVWSPRPDTQQHFQRRVAGILHALLTGTWDGIPRAQAEPRTRFHLGRWTLRTVRALAVIAAPAVTVLALDAGGRPLPGTVAGGLLALSVIGAVLWIDDKLPTKLALMEQAGKAVASLKPKS